MRPKWLLSIQQESAARTLPVALLKVIAILPEASEVELKDFTTALFRAPAVAKISKFASFWTGTITGSQTLRNVIKIGLLIGNR